MSATRISWKDWSNDAGYSALPNKMYSNRKFEFYIFRNITVLLYLWLNKCRLGDLYISKA